MVKAIASENLSGLPADFLLELGSMTALWGQLERELNILLMILAGNRDAHASVLVLITHSNFRQRLESVGALCQLHEEAGLAMPNPTEVCKLLSKAQAHRNRFAHNSCLPDSSTGEVLSIHVSARNKLKYGTVRVPVSELTEANKLIWEAKREIVIFMAEVVKALGRPKANRSR